MRKAVYGVGRIMEDKFDSYRKAWDEQHREGKYVGYAVPTYMPRRSASIWVPALLDNLPNGWLIKNMKVLEIGCGAGHMIEPLASMVREVHGVDISEEAIKIGNKRLSHLKNVYLHVMGGDSLSPFRAKTFNFVFSWQSFQHMPEIAMFNYLEEANRILKPSGYFVFQINSSIKPVNRIESVKNLINGTQKYTSEEITETVNKAGLSLVSISNQPLVAKGKWFWVVCKRGWHWRNQLAWMSLKEIQEFESWRKNYDKLSFEEHKKEYERWSKRYSHQRSSRIPFFVAAFTRLVDMGVNLGKKSVAELGSTDGWLACNCMKKFTFKSWKGYDISKNRVESTMSEAKKLEFVNIELHKQFWETDVEKFDIFVSGHTIEHFNDADFLKLIDFLHGRAEIMILEIATIDNPNFPNRVSWYNFGESHILAFEKIELDKIIKEKGFEEVNIPNLQKCPSFCKLYRKKRNE